MVVICIVFIWEYRMEKVYVVAPVYNEEASIEAFVVEWHAVVAHISGESRLLVVNDGSTDATLSLLDGLARRYSQLVVADKPNAGHGPAIHYGYEKALEAGADYIFQTDSDRQTSPRDFQPFWEARDRFDACIGVRVDRQDGLARRCVAAVLRLTLLAVFGLSIPDANTPFRLLRRTVLQDALALIPHDHPLTNVMLSVVLAAQKKTIDWLPITFCARRSGVNSINLRRIVRMGLRAIRNFLAFRTTLHQAGLR